MILRQLRTEEETPARTPWPLLLLRLALAALIIVALAGPILNAPAPSAATGPLVFVVDDTFVAAPGWRDRQNALRAGAEEAVRSGRPIYVIRAAQPPGADPLTPYSGEEARKIAATIRPAPFLADRRAATAGLNRLDKALEGVPAEIRWLADGVATDGVEAFVEALKRRGRLDVFVDDARPKLILRAGAPTAKGRTYRLERLNASAALNAEIVATARDGRVLARVRAEAPAGARSADVGVDMPLAMRNEIATVSIEGYASAGAVALADARDKRALVGFIAGVEAAGDPLLSGAHYVRTALAPYAEFLTDSLENLLQSEVSVIILDDVGRLRASDADALQAWIAAGGVVIRFAGPKLADAAQDVDPPLLPAPLRGGGRAFGGALTWETPQRIAAFSPDGPFAGLQPPDDVLVRRQVLARPGGEVAEKSWANLADGTPIVTGERIGQGALALFHVPATPGWSDLPLSGAFVEMLRKLTFLSVLGPGRAEADTGARLAPLRVLDGYGRFERPAPEVAGVTAADAARGAAPGRPPGFYGASEAPLAVNALASDFPFRRLELANVATKPYVAESPARLAPPLFAAALSLLALDALIILGLSGRLRFRTALAAVALIALAPAGRSEAQPLDAPIDAKTRAAALQTRLAYVATGDPEADRISERGLAGLTAELIRRTSVEPAPPAAVNPETDDLAVYPLLYWPIVAGAAAPSEAALTNIENFMRFGGLILLDTRDDERAVGSVETPERAALKEVLAQIDVPPLTPLPQDHVLTRSFYLLDDLPGRMQNAPVFVQADGEENDGVTPLIIGGRDWAGAWAVDEVGRPLRPVSGMGRCGMNVPARECALRAGINIAMVAFTGNYKTDQVHTPILLERLGRR